MNTIKTSSNNLACVNSKRTCSSFDMGKCKMTKAKCVFHATSIYTQGNGEKWGFKNIPSSIRQ